MPDKMSKEKIDLLRAYGAEVVVAPDRRRAGVARVLLPRRRPPGRRDPRRVPAQPVLQPGQPRRALPLDRPRDLGADRRAHHAPRRRRRHRRHDHRHRALPQGAQPGHRDHRRRPGRLDLLERRGQAVPGRGRRRGLLARDVRPDDRRPLGHGHRQRRLPHHPPPGAGGGPARRRLERHGDARRARGRARHRRPERARSSSCCPTAGATTCRRSSTTRG